jgi:hypothetical protein
MQVPMGLGVMPVVRLKLFEFLKQRLSHSHFWCQRLAWVQQGEAGSPAPFKELDKQLWQDMRARLNVLLVQEQTFHEFMAYLVDTKRTRFVESPASRT